jgi:hypothetical protein
MACGRSRRRVRDGCRLPVVVWRHLLLRLHVSRHGCSSHRGPASGCGGGPLRLQRDGERRLLQQRGQVARDLQTSGHRAEGVPAGRTRSRRRGARDVGWRSSGEVAPRSRWDSRASAHAVSAQRCGRGGERSAGGVLDSSALDRLDDPAACSQLVSGTGETVLTLRSVVRHQGEGRWRQTAPEQHGCGSAHTLAVK